MGELRLAVAALLCATVIGVAFIVTCNRIAHLEPEQLTVENGVPAFERVAPGTSVPITYVVCNRTGEPGSALVLSAWVAEGQPIPREGSGAAVLSITIKTGCSVVVPPAPDAPQVAGSWRRVGLLIVTFERHHPEITALASRPVEVQ